jgi:hypothetical protein
MGKKEEALKVFKEAASLDGDLDVVAAIHTYLKGGVTPSVTNDSVFLPNSTKRSNVSSTSSTLPDEPPPLEKDDEPIPTSSSSHFKLTKRNSDSHPSYVCQNC